MRGRSKSMFVERGAISEDMVTSILNTSDSNDWLFEDKLKLIIQVKNLVSNKDNIPFDKRLETIKWDNIEIDSYSTAEIKEEFCNIIKHIRTYRILPEVIKDAEKDLRTALQIKKPLSSFALFMHEKKDEINLKNSTVNLPYVQAAANIFKSLPDKERQHYTFKAQKAKKDYDEELSKFQTQDHSIQEKISCNQKKISCNQKKISCDQKMISCNQQKISPIKKEDSCKTSPTSPFSYFLQEVKHNDSTANFHNVRKVYSEMKSEEKLIWILKFLGTTSGNLLTLEQYEKAVSSLNKDEMSLVDDYEKRPKKLNAFNVFMKKYLMEADNNIDATLKFKSAIKSWKNLPETEKTKLKEESAELKKLYNKNFDAFWESLPVDRKNYEQNKIKRKSRKISEKEVEVKTEVNHKEKRSRKNGENQENTISSEPPSKISKISKNKNSIENVPKKLVVSKKRNIDKFDFKLVKPPGSLYKYFALNVFEGPREKAKSTFKALSQDYREQLNVQYEKTKSKYLKKFEKYLVSLSADEIALFAEKINENGNDDNVSDVTDSDEIYIN